MGRQQTASHRHTPQPDVVALTFSLTFASHRPLRLLSTNGSVNFIGNTQRTCTPCISTVQFQFGLKMCFGKYNSNDTQHNAGINFFNGHNGNFIHICHFGNFEQCTEANQKESDTHTHAHKKEKTNLSFVSWFFFVSGFHSHRHQTPSRIYKSFVCNWLYFVSPFDLMFGFLFVRFALKIPKLLASICALFHLSGSSIKEHFNFNQLAICSKLKNLINYLIKSKSLLKKWNVQK